MDGCSDAEVVVFFFFCCSLRTPIASADTRLSLMWWSAVNVDGYSQSSCVLGSWYEQQLYSQQVKDPMTRERRIETSTPIKLTPVSGTVIMVVNVNILHQHTQRIFRCIR